MSSPLDTNYLFLDPLLRAKVAELFPDVVVGGFVEYMDFLDQGGETPAIYVYPGDDESLPGKSAHQAIVKQPWEVAIVTTPPRVDGVADLSAHGALVSQAIRGLSGVTLAPGIRELVRQANPSPMRYGAGMCLSYLAFSCSFEMR